MEKLRHKINIKVKTENERSDVRVKPLQNKVSFPKERKKIKLKKLSSFEWADYILFSSPLKRVHWHH